ncbi:MAG: hypothetical protein RL763_1199, partial [Pseudomonadota bacterium]
LDAHGPGGAVADDRLFLVGGQIVVRHPIEIIVGLIVGADMLKAKAKILPLPVAALGSAKLARLRAAGMVAAIGAHHGLFRGIGFNAYAVK